MTTETKTVDWNKALCLAKFRVKLRSLADESKIIRHEAKRMKSRFRKQHTGPCAPAYVLTQHRLEVVRPESRATLLARAYYLQRPYRTVEQMTTTPVPFKRVVGILRSLTGTVVTPQEIVIWTQQ